MAKAPVPKKVTKQASPKKVTKQVTNVGGRPTVFRKEHETTARKMMQLGAREYEVAEALGINATTLWRWKQKHEGFRKALEEGEEAKVKNVEKSLYDKARGYSYETEKVMKDAKGNLVRVQVTEHVQPSDASIQFFLTNRAASRWQKKIDHTHGGGENPIEVVDHTSTNVAMRVAFLMDKAIRDQKSAGDGPPDTPQQQQQAQENDNE